MISKNTNIIPFLKVVAHLEIGNSGKLKLAKRFKISPEVFALKIQLSKNCVKIYEN